jgi:hypothetical protein
MRKEAKGSETRKEVKRVEKKWSLPNSGYYSSMSPGGTDRATHCFRSDGVPVEI